MTINEMLEQGITLQGHIVISQYDPEADERFTVYEEVAGNGLQHHVDEPWADMPVGYMYSPYGMNGMTIEVG